MRDTGRATMPAAVSERYGLQQGSELILTEEGNLLILYPRVEEQVEKLLDQIGKTLDGRGIRLKELLKDSEQMRLGVVQERYPELAQGYDL